MTRLARQATDEAEADAYRADRADTLGAHDYTARIREDDDTLILYPDEWLDGDTVELDRIDDTDRAVEIPLSGAGDDTWAAVEADNAALVTAVGEAHGSIHEANARAFADFMGNHYCRRIESATADHLAEFCEEYYPRNVWADADQQAALDASLEYLFGVADTECPERSAKM
ncbi:rnhA operon protein [Halonotius roseus]|uniref:RnhA operon protein n=1 Tax=Halonotius roseus TaxID=2511997 RepID=A0A544QSU4_9EURY|nr:rnhA operon protein [Halonotius roseus]